MVYAFFYRSVITIELTLLICCCLAVLKSFVWERNLQAAAGCGNLRRPANLVAFPANLRQPVPFLKPFFLLKKFATLGSSVGSDCIVLEGWKKTKGCHSVI